VGAGTLSTLGMVPLLSVSLEPVLPNPNSYYWSILIGDACVDAAPAASPRPIATATANFLIFMLFTPPAERLINKRKTGTSRGL